MVVAFIDIFNMYQTICDPSGELIAAVDMAELPGRLVGLSEDILLVCDLDSVAESITEKIKDLNPNAKVRLMKNV